MHPGNESNIAVHNLMELNLNTRIRLIAIVKILFMLTKNKCFHFVRKNLV